jgi:hypothetical protein
MASSPLARAASVNIPLSGNFTAGVSGGGTANLTGASGTFKQWTFFFHTNIDVDADPQEVGVNVTPVGSASYASTGNSNLTYNSDVNLGGPSPISVDSLDVDLTGASAIPLGLNVENIDIDTSLGTFQLQLTFAGSIDDLQFVSSGGSDPGAVYDVPGTYEAILNGSVSGKLVNVPLLGTIDLGTLFTLESDTMVSVEGSLPGIVGLTDGSGGAGPFPADLLANYGFAFPGDLSFPLILPIDVNETATVPNGQSGFSELHVGGEINAVLTLTGASYDLNGTVAGAVVPEPTSLALAGMGAIGLCVAAWRRRRK